MTDVCILSAGIADVGRLPGLDNNEHFRKATLNMKLSTLALQQALEPLASLKNDLSDKMTLFLGTGHGEFNATLDFLKGWAQQKFARPFLFQNSLHNSTTGFLCLNQGYQAPSCTVSHHYFSGEDALDLACQFVVTGFAEITAVIGVDTRTGENLPMLEAAGFPHEGWGQGAGAVILASRKFCDTHNLRWKGRLVAVDKNPALDVPVHQVRSDFELSHFYDSHAIERLAQSVLNGGSQELLLDKPNGGASRICWIANSDV